MEDMGLVALRGDTRGKESGGSGGHGAGGTGRWQQGHGAHSGCREPPALPARQNRGCPRAGMSPQPRGQKELMPPAGCELTPAEHRVRFSPP